MSIRVNGQTIPEEAVEYELARLVRFYSAHMPADEIRSQMDLLRRKAREQAIGAKLLIDESRKLDIRVPPEDVESRLRDMIQHAGGKEAFSRALRKQDLTLETVRDSIERGRRVDLLVERITAGVPEPTEEQMQAHFEAHRQEYRQPDRAQTQHILIKPDSDSEAHRQTAISRLLEIKRKIEDGADFADQAAAHSHCPSGRQTGGSLGWITRGAMVSEFDNVVFSMEIGSLSDVVETGLGFHLIRKTAHEAGGLASFDDVRDKVCDFIRHAARGEVLAAHVKELREAARIEED